MDNNKDRTSTRMQVQEVKKQQGQDKKKSVKKRQFIQNKSQVSKKIKIRGLEL